MLLKLNSKSSLLLEYDVRLDLFQISREWKEKTKSHKLYQPEVCQQKLSFDYSIGFQIPYIARGIDARFSGDVSFCASKNNDFKRTNLSK